MTLLAHRTDTDPEDFDTALVTIARNAGPEDRGASIAASMQALQQAGALEDDGLADPRLTARRLMRVGAANLSAGRLIEGHINARGLVRTYGDAEARRHADSLLRSGAILGVWGADGAEPVRLDEGEGVLRGQKSFASGLGTVTHAVVSVDVGAEAGTRLALIDVTNKGRASPEDWRMPGMRATVSGGYDFNGLAEGAFTWIGDAGDYFKEPHFIGGVWRIAALQAGAAIGLVEAAAARLRAIDRLGAEAQRRRFGSVAMELVALAPLVENAADAPADQRTLLSIAARLRTEAAGLDAIRATEQGLGLQHFSDRSTTGRMARDLSVYLRQAARDALLLRFSDHVLAEEGNLWTLLP